MLREWNSLPDCMRIEAIKPYYNYLKSRSFHLILKRTLDIILSLSLLIILFPIFLGIAIWIKLDSEGSVFFRQERVTQYGKIFRIFKFRTMVMNAEKKGYHLTVENDIRLTRVGTKIRHLRLDEIPQLLNVLIGDMTFVGTRPELPKYTKEYTNEMKATFLLPAGITSYASILYKNECELLKKSGDPDYTYIKEILPTKMKYNLEQLKSFSIWQDIKTIVNTIKVIV